MSQSNILLEVGTNELEIVEFIVNQNGYMGHYGLNVAKVVEIIRRQKVTHMPEIKHRSILGTFAHRGGRVVPLIDMAIYLHSNPIDNPDAKIIVTEFNTVTTAFLVSGVNRIYRLSWTDVETPGRLLQSMSHNAVTGVVRLDSRVVFLLDLEAIVAELHPGTAIHMDPDTAGRSKEALPILHTDDSGSIRTLMRDMLTREGRFALTQTTDGQEAWNHLCRLVDEAQRKNIPITDLVCGVISDIEMPALDGLTLCRKIKEHPVLRVLPVVMFSSLINDQLAAKCKSVEADAQFSKPDLKSLSDKLYELVKERQLAV